MPTITVSDSTPRSYYVEQASKLMEQKGVGLLRASIRLQNVGDCPWDELPDVLRYIGFTVVDSDYGRANGYDQD